MHPKEDTNDIFFLKVEISNYSVTIVGWNFFNEAVSNDRIKYDIVWKITTVRGDNYANSCLLDYFYFKGQYQIIVIDLSKQQALDAGLKAVQLINFTGNLDQAEGSIIFFPYWRSIKIKKELWKDYSFILLWCND